jgi:hypothetical protein
MSESWSRPRGAGDWNATSRLLGRRSVQQRQPPPGRRGERCRWNRPSSTRLTRRHDEAYIGIYFVALAQPCSCQYGVRSRRTLLVLSSCASSGFNAVVTCWAVCRPAHSGASSFEIRLSISG